MTGRRVLVGIVLAVTLLAACGSSGVDVAPRAQRQLQAQLDEVRSAVAAADSSGARSALRGLERSVGKLVAAGLVSDARAAEILAAAEDVATRLSLLPASEASPSMSLSPSPSPTSKPPKPDKPGKGHGYGHDEGHGNGD
jgi:hypothetical protein